MPVLIKAENKKNCGRASWLRELILQGCIKYFSWWVNKKGIHGLFLLIEQVPGSIKKGYAV